MRRDGNFLLYLLIFMVVGCLEIGVSEAAPPGDGWSLSFEDNFSGDALSSDKWTTEFGEGWAGIQSSRWPENVSVNDDNLILLTKKESRGNKKWTTGQIMSKSFKQQHGYFEIRMKINAAAGIDNAFWLTSPKFEIDVAEVFFPHKILATTHNFQRNANRSNKISKNGVDLSEDFHNYGLLWEDDQLTWYFDGEPIAHQSCSFCDAPVMLRVSSAVVDWEGAHESQNNTQMNVDWVRVYNR